jgi:serine/threonine protein kinase
MLAKYRHPNIVLLIGICSVPSSLAIVTEFVKAGSLYELIHKRKVRLTADERRRIVKQILSAVNYLHQHNVVHRDIKSHNFLVYENFVVKLCDFGLARCKDRLQQGPMQFSGTPAYMAQ